MKKFQTVYPLIFAIYPALFMYSSNFSEVSASSLPSILILTIMATALLWLGFYALTRDVAKSSLFIMPVMVIFFATGHIAFDFVDRFWQLEPWLEAFKSKKHISFTPAGFWGVTIISFGIILAAVFYLKTYKISEEKLAKITKSLFAVSLILIVFQVIEISKALMTKESDSAKKEVSTQLAVEATNNYPDIYYIIPDGYPRADVLKKYHNYDNSGFINNLKAKGFFVAENNYSNYGATFLSLTSSMNMRYINYFTEKNGKNSQYILNVYNELWDNEIYKFLKTKGYTTYHLQNSWVGSKNNHFADVQIPCLETQTEGDLFKNLYVNSTLLYLFVDNNIAQNSAQCHMNGVDKISKLYQQPGPKFVMAHFRIPHPPYIFDRDGNFIKNDLYTDNTEGPKVRAWIHFEQFVDQMIFISKQIEQMADTIIKNSTRPVVIVVQSDHGARITISTASNDYKKARHSNFVAAYFPDGANLFNNDISPVNIFRIIFNHYLGASFEILPNKYYFSEYARPFDFKELDVNSEK